MHPALRKGPRFLQTPHFPFFTKNTPILHFCTKKTPLPISFPAYRPAHSARLRPWSVDNQRGTFSCTNPISTQTNAPICCYQSSDIHRTLMQQTFRSPKQATSYSFKEITFYHWRKSCTNPTSTQTNVPICYYQSSDIHRTQTTHATDISITETGHVLHRAVD